MNRRLSEPLLLQMAEWQCLVDVLLHVITAKISSVDEGLLAIGPSRNRNVLLTC